MDSIDPFDRSTWTQTQDPLPAALDGCRAQAAMLLAFVQALEEHLSHEDALYLAAQVWRAS